jgi:hypothetical protein
MFGKSKPKLALKFYTPEEYTQQVKNGIIHIYDKKGKIVPQDPEADYIVLKEEWLDHVFNLVPGDDIEFTLTWNDPFNAVAPHKTVWSHTHACTYTEKINYTKVLRYDEFHGVKNAIVWVVGYKKKP